MTLKLKIILWIVGVLGAWGAMSYGLYRFADYHADAREATVRLEWSQEREALIAAKQQAEKDAADARREAEGIKQGNTQRGEQVIEQTRNIDTDWSNTPLPAGLYETLRQN